VASGFVVLLGLFLLVDAAVRGSWDVVLRTLGPTVALAWVLWVLAARPHLRVDDEALTVVNPLRVTRLPWGAVSDVRQRWQIEVDSADGRTVRSLGGPGPRSAGLSVVADRWQERRSVAGGPPTRGWDRPAVVAGIVALVLLVVALLA
jgi:hypothetical protein